MDKFGLAAICMIVIAAIEIVALFCGHNGQLLVTTVAAIAAVAAGTIGYGAAQVKASSSSK